MALGAAAALALTGSGTTLTRRRGSVEQTPAGPVLLSWHPSAILRQPDPDRAAGLGRGLVADLALSLSLIAAPAAGTAARLAQGGCGQRPRPRVHAVVAPVGSVPRTAGWARAITAPRRYCVGAADPAPSFAAAAGRRARGR